MPRFIHQLISTQCSYSTPCCHPSPPTQKKAETRSGGGRLCELGSLFRFILSVYVSMGNAIKLILDMYILTPSQPETAMKLGSGAVLLVFFVVVSQCKHLRRCTCATGRIHGRCPDGTGKTWEELKIVILVWLLPLVLLCPCQHPFPG